MITFLIIFILLNNVKSEENVNKVKDEKNEKLFDISASINEILSDENLLEKSKFIQQLTILRKINLCLLYYLSTKCKGYKIIALNKRNQETEFLFVKKILKGNKIVYDIDDYRNEIVSVPNNQKSIIRRKFQLFQLSESS